MAHERCWDLLEGRAAQPDVPGRPVVLVSTLWDDDWTCTGGRTALVEDLLHDPELGPRARQVELGDDDATPPGYEAR
jgi:hypothetical protein